MPLIIDGILLCVGSYWFVTSVASLTLFQGMSIGGGLLPAFASGLLILLVIINLRQARQDARRKRQGLRP